MTFKVNYVIIPYVWVPMNPKSEENIKKKGKIMEEFNELSYLFEEEMYNKGYTAYLYENKKTNKYEIIVWVNGRPFMVEFNRIEGNYNKIINYIMDNLKKYPELFL